MEQLDITTLKTLDVLKNPLWYMHFKDQFEEYFFNFSQNQKNKPQEWFEKRINIALKIGKLFEDKKLTFGIRGINHDKERKPIDTIVIHHTSTNSQTPTLYIDTLGLIRLYIYEHLNTKNNIYAKPIYSGHFINGKQTFIAYHYLVRSDGSTEHTLDDSYIGWHAGNWDINCKSIAIAFVDELEEKSPSDEALKSAEAIIKKYINVEVLGHCEIAKHTVCPGSDFLFNNNWKRLLF